MSERSIFEDVLRAEREAVRAICLRGVDGDVARHIARIEINHDIECAIIDGLDGPMVQRIAFGTRVGPMQLEGVDVYVVDNLPAPGWRVINPLARL